MKSPAEYVVKRLGAVQGWTIVGAVVGDGGFPAILVRKGGREAWLDIQCDAEGNGPGWVSVVPVEAAETAAALKSLESEGLFEVRRVAP